MYVKLHSVCVKLDTVCEITQCAQSYTHSIGEKKFSVEKFYTDAVGSVGD